jgi:hypothetical protein
VVTENLKMLMVPYLEAQVLAQLFDKREERVRQAHVYYLEYLKLMRHYDLLEKHQVTKLKIHLDSHKATLKGADGDETKNQRPKNPMEMM